MIPRIQIIATGEFLKLSSKGLTVTVRSGLFQAQGSLIGSTSYPFTAPLEDNKAAINNAQIIHSDAGLRIVMVRLWLGPIPWKVARMSFIIKNSEISATLVIDTGNLAKQLKTLKLNNLPDDAGYNQIFIGGYANFVQFMNATAAAAPGVYPVVFFPFKNDGAYKTGVKEDDYPDIQFPWNIFMNSWAIDSSGNGTFQLNPAGGQNKQTAIPFFYLVYILKRIVTYLGFRPTGAWLDDPDANRIVIEGVLPVYGYISLSDFTYYMPDVPVSDFLDELKTRFGVDIVFDQLNGTAEITSIDYLRRSNAVVDLRDAQLISFEEQDIAKPAFTITESIDNGDMAFTETDRSVMPVLSVGNVNNATDVTEIQLKSVATKMISETAPTWAQSVNWRIPWIKRKIYGATPFDQISDIDYNDRAKAGMRFLYYHGLQPSAQGFLYPYGSSDNLNIFGEPISKYSLALNAAGTTYQATQRKYDFIKNSKPFEMGFQLTPAEFLQLRGTNLILVRDPYTRATVNCLLSEAPADLGAGEMVLAKATLYPDIVPVNASEIIPETPANNDPPFDNGTVYIKLVKQNESTESSSQPPPPHSTSYADFVARFYSDAAGTVPKDVTTLKVRIKITIAYNFQPPSSAFQEVKCSSNAGTSIVLVKATTSSSSPGYNVSYNYQLATSADYIILP